MFAPALIPRVEPTRRSVLYCAIDGRALLPMLPIKPLPWLLALLLCWQAVATTTAPMKVPADGPAATATGHLVAATDDCEHAMPKHCAESRSLAAGADHCGQHCKHCPSSATGHLLTLIAVIPMPATSGQPSFTQLPFSSRQPLVIHRPPIAA